MDCVCGCGAKVPRRRSDANLDAGRIALELFAWDRARAEGRLRADPDAEPLIERGAERYRSLLAVLHGAPEAGEREEARAWLAESEELRRDRPEMTDRGGLLTRDKLRLHEGDMDRVDRLRPERSVTGAAPGGAGADERLDRLRALRDEGVLNEDEYAAAAARLRDEGESPGEPSGP